MCALGVVLGEPNKAGRGLCGLYEGFVLFVLCVECVMSV